MTDGSPAPANGAGSSFFVHPQGLVESESVGEGTRVWAFAHVLKGAVVGAGCNLCECVFVENGAVLGKNVTVKNGVQIWDGVTCEDFVFVGPNATFTNDLRPRVANPADPADFAKTLVQYGATLGANCTIVAGHRIGRNAMVGAGAVVTKDVPDHALVVGNPARRVGWVCACGQSLDEALGCPGCGAIHQESRTGLVAK